MDPRLLAGSAPLSKWARLVWSVALGVAILVLGAGYLASKAHLYYLDFSMAAPSAVSVQASYDKGHGWVNAPPTIVPVAASTALQHIRFRVPTGAFLHLRLDPAIAPAPAWVEVGPVTIWSRGDELMGRREPRLTLEPTAFQPTNQIARIEPIDPHRARLVLIDNANDPYCLIATAPFRLDFNWRYFWRGMGRALAAAVLGGVIVFWAVAQGWAGWAARLLPALGRWAQSHHRLAVTAAAAAAVTLSAYPVVFFGRSYVSPDNGCVLLYQSFPTLPGYRTDVVEDVKGSDVAALLLAHLPYAHVERRAVAHDGSLPLWNRYNSGGSILLGQGQSMFGDPLHCLVLLADDAAWAWDLKFLLAKLLLGIGAGWLVLVMTRSLPVALLLAFSSVFIGFFGYRLNHPAFFSLCYSPWIVYAWQRVTAASSRRAVAGWCAGLMLANWSVMNSGTIKEAYMLMGGLNFCGLLLFLMAEPGARPKAGKLLALLWAGVLFVAISAPIWLTFSGARAESYTLSDKIAVGQAPLALVLGAFDDLLYRALNADQTVVLPSANFLILFGVLYALVNIFSLMRDRGFRAVFISALVPFALVFGIVPPAVVQALPVLSNIGHVHNTFSCVLIIHFIILAGFGLRRCWERFATTAEWWFEMAFVAIFFGALAGSYFNYSAPGTALPPKNGFFVGYFLLTSAAMFALPVLSRLMARRPRSRLAAALPWVLCLVMLHWRHGLHLWTGFDDYVQNPRLRADLRAPSPAISWMQREAHTPFRAAGFGLNLFPGYSDMYDLEGVFGPDALMNPFYRELLLADGVPMVWDWRFDLERPALAHELRLWSMLNTRYFVDAPGLPDAAYAPLERRTTLDFSVYENPAVWPRAFFTDRVTPVRSAADLVKRLNEGDGRPFAAVAPEEISGREARMVGLDDPSGVVAPAEDYQLRENSTAFTVRAPRAGMVVLDEAYLKNDFRLTVNGKPAPYVRVNHAFKGLWVEGPGTYRITFSYWPKYLSASLWTSVAGLSFMAIWLALVSRWPQSAAED